jgi:hypothetical protein
MEVLNTVLDILNMLLDVLLNILLELLVWELDTDLYLLVTLDMDCITLVTLITRLELLGMETDNQ